MAANFRGLQELEDGTGMRFVAGVVLYDSEWTASFGNGLYPVPHSELSMK